MRAADFARAALVVLAAREYVRLFVGPLLSQVANAVVRQFHARQLLYRRNGLQRAILAVRAFRERYYSPPSGPGFLDAARRFDSAAAAEHANASWRVRRAAQELPCPQRAPPVVGAQAHAAHGREPRAGGSDN